MLNTFFFASIKYPLLSYNSYFLWTLTLVKVVLHPSDALLTKIWILFEYQLRITGEKKLFLFACDDLCEWMYNDLCDYACIFLSSSYPCDFLSHTMHEFTRSHLTYPFTPHPLFTESGHTHIDYADFLKSKMLHYADNTCLTGRNWVDVNIQKLTIFHFKKLFFPCHSCWVEGEEKRRSSCLGGIVSASIASVDKDVCNIFLSFPHEARSHASFTFCGIVFEEKILIFINVRVHATFFFFWHALNIQHHPQVKSINSFRLHESGHRGECWENYCLSVNAWIGDIQNPHVVVLEASFIILFQTCSFQILCWHAQHTLT